LRLRGTMKKVGEKVIMEGILEGRNGGRVGKPRVVSSTIKEKTNQQN